MEVLQKNKFKIIVAIVMILALCALLYATSYADVGNSFSGGKSSSQSSSSSHSGSGDSGMIYVLIQVLLSIPFPLNIIIVAVVVVGYFMFQRAKNSQAAGAEPVYKSVDNGDAVSSIKRLDDAFSGEAFKTFVKEVFIKVQETWESKKWETIRPFESNELFSAHAAQLDEFIKKGWTNHLDGQEIKSVSLVHHTAEGGFEYVVVRLQAALIDYTTDDSGKVIAGSQTERVQRTYKLVFKRTQGVKTTSGANKTTNCPNCGAPTDITSSGQCTYCRSVITTGEYGWVLNEYGDYNA